MSRANRAEKERQEVIQAEPTDRQIERCKLMGWDYMGDGLFECGSLMGYFTETGKFIKF